jgi:hypothetical protein
MKKQEEAKRDSVEYRFDILYAPFIRRMAEIAAYGANKYGDFNWHKSRLDGEKGPINHLENHLNLYKDGKSYDHSEVGVDKKIHLAAVAFNAMMEYYYEDNA